MSIQSQINRINGAKDNLVTSIENQGVAVPDGTKIDALSTYVDAINNSNHNHEISDVTGLQNALDAKLEKTTYEKSAELALGSNGKVCLGKFGAYDTNITIELNSTTHTGYHATIIIFSQNVAISSTNGSVGCYVYGDANNYVTPLLSIFRPYGSASRQIEVYANLPGWSKNLVHVQGVALSTGGMTDVLTSVETIPTAIDGKIKVTPVNVLTTNFASKTELAGKANDADLKTVAKTGSYNDLTNKPSIPAAVTVDSALSSTSTNPVQNKVINSALAGKMSIVTTNGNYLNTKTYISTHPENGGASIIPYLYNDIAHLIARGGACSIYTTNATSYTAVDLAKVKTVAAEGQLFDASPSYQNNFSSALAGGNETLIIDITCHKTFYWTSTIYIDFGAAQWIPSNVKILTSVDAGTYTERMSVTGLTTSLYKTVDYSSAGFNRIRFVLEKANPSLRIAQIGVINYGSAGVTETFVSRGGSSLFGSLIPYNNYGANLGGLNNQWNSIYGGTIYEGGTALSSKYAKNVDLKAVAKSGSYNDLTNKPTIPSIDGLMPLSGGRLTGPIDFANSTGNNKTSNYLSAGGGYSTGSGRLGLKVVALDQSDAQMGLGVDCTGGPYELTVATGRVSDSQASKIVFATHTTESKDYKTLATLSHSGASANAVTFNVAGTIQENGTALSSKYVTNTKLEEVLGSYVNDIDALLGG